MLAHSLARTAHYIFCFNMLRLQMFPLWNLNTTHIYHTYVHSCMSCTGPMHTPTNTHTHTHAFVFVKRHSHLLSHAENFCVLVLAADFASPQEEVIPCQISPRATQVSTLPNHTWRFGKRGREEFSTEEEQGASDREGADSGCHRWDFSSNICVSVVKIGDLLSAWRKLYS